MVKAFIDPIYFTPYISAHVEEPNTFASPLLIPNNPKKKNDDICGLRLFVFIVLKATKEPNKYEPLSPKKIFDFGKLNKTKEAKTIN